MDYILYTTEGFTQDKTGIDTENCQILDFQFNSKMKQKECIKEFISNNPNYNEENIKIVCVLPDDINEMIRKIIKCISNKDFENNNEFSKNIQVLNNYFKTQY